MKSFIKFIRDIREKKEEDGPEIPEIGFTYNKDKKRFQFCLMDMDGFILDDLDDDKEDTEVDEAIKKGQ